MRAHLRRLPLLRAAARLPAPRSAGLVPPPAVTRLSCRAQTAPASPDPAEILRVPNRPPEPEPRAHPTLGAAAWRSRHGAHLAVLRAPAVAIARSSFSARPLHPSGDLRCFVPFCSRPPRSSSRLSPPTAAAQETADASTARSRLARERAPAVLAARLQVEEARGRLDRRAGAARREPHPERRAGPARFRAGPGGGRRPRRGSSWSSPSSSAASAGRPSPPAEAEVAAASRQRRGRPAADRGGGGARVLPRACTRPSACAWRTATQETLARSAGALERRHQAGDVPVLDVNLARDRPARATGRGARGAGPGAGGRGRAAAACSACPAEAPLALAGDLRGQRRYDLPACSRAPATAPRRAPCWPRPAQARGRGGAGTRRALAAAGPGRGLRARRAARTSCWAPLALELPLFQRGQGLRAARRGAGPPAGAARRRPPGARREAAVRAAFGAHTERLAAAKALEEALPLVAGQRGAGRARATRPGSSRWPSGWWCGARRSRPARTTSTGCSTAAEAGVALALAAGVSP